MDVINLKKNSKKKIKFYYDQSKNDESEIKADISDYLHILLISKKIFKNKEAFDSVYIDRRWPAEKKLMVLITYNITVTRELERLKKLRKKKK